LNIIKYFGQVFHRFFRIFHNGRGGWIKVERNGGKWREGKGIMVRIGGYKNWVKIRKRTSEDAL
jgi:hypothetical protein